MGAARQAISAAELEHLFFARDFALDILRRFFVEEPSQEYVKAFVHGKMPDLFPFHEDSEGIAEGISLIKSYLEKNDPVNSRSDFEDLHWDYTRMFLGPFEIPVEPWESVYVRKDNLLFQKTTMDVRKLYQKYGYETAELNIGPDDHIGIELDFLYRLNRLCIDSCKSDRASREITYLVSEQLRFVKGHLAVFAPKMAAKMAAHSETDFYKGLAKLLEHYLEMDSIVLTELLNIDILPN